MNMTNIENKENKMKFIIESDKFRVIFSDQNFLSSELDNIFKFLIHFGPCEMVQNNIKYKVVFV